MPLSLLDAESLAFAGILSPAAGNPAPCPQLFGSVPSKAAIVGWQAALDRCGQFGPGGGAPGRRFVRTRPEMSGFNRGQAATARWRAALDKCGQFEQPRADPARGRGAFCHPPALWQVAGVDLAIP